MNAIGARCYIQEYAVCPEIRYVDTRQFRNADPSSGQAHVRKPEVQTFTIGVSNEKTTAGIRGQCARVTEIVFCKDAIGSAIEIEADDLVGAAVQD